jgi:hypothetical protein
MDEKRGVCMDIVSKAMAAVGYVLALGSAGVSDYYTLVLGEPEPAGTWFRFALGTMMLLPELIRHVVKTKKRRNSRKRGIIRYDPDAGKWGYFRPYDYDEEEAE